MAFRLDSGDSGPSRALEQFAENCDVLIHMCSYISCSVDDEATRIGTSGHLEAAATAARARRLVATHIYHQFDVPGVRRDGARLRRRHRARRGFDGALD